MSRTFHKKYILDDEGDEDYTHFIKQWKKWRAELGIRRAMKWLTEEAVFYDVEGEFRDITRRVIQSSTYSLKIRQLVDKLFDPKYSWTLIPEYWDQSWHPIFTEYTQRKIREVMTFNPNLTEIYFEKNPEILLLENNPTPKKELSEKTKQSLYTKLWTMILALLPSEDYMTSAAFAREILRSLIDWVMNVQFVIEWHINIWFAQINAQKAWKTRNILKD